jgi:serine/threonine protein kinase
MSTDPRPATSRAGTQPGGGWTPPTVEHLQALLPQYEITAMLGHGGMGAVYKGRQKSLDRVVAIKILPPGLENSDAKFVERFQNEARTMARLMHPGIVAVFDFGETEEGQLYFVMEYVDGTDVAKMIQSSGKLPQDYALAITAHVCDALAYAHANGVVHRDIKPANILINMQGQIKVADFGLAKADDPSQTSGLTKTGYAMGTPDYVSPEALIIGSSIDGRADLYAVGVMLYQMLTGEIPRGLFQMPNVRTNGETDPRFDAIISKAMQTDREARYQSAAELRRELDVILSTPHIKQDASKVIAAVPQQAVAETPGKRSAVAVKPGAKGPQQQAVTPNRQSAMAETKPKTGLWLGIAAAVVVIGGAAFMLSGGKPEVARPSKVENSASPDSTLESRATPPKPKSAPKAATIAPTNSDGWIDGLAEWLAVPGNAVKGTLKQEGAVWRWVGPEAVFLGANPPAKSLANVAVRLTFQHGGRSTVGIKLRIGKTANYNAVIRPDGVTEIKLMKDLQETVLAKFDPIPGFDPRVSHVMEFRAQGDVLTLLVDGQTRGSVKDATLVTGSFAVVYGLIEKIEYRDLGTARAALVVAGAGSDGWTDGLAEWLAVPGNVNTGILTQENGGWRVAKGESVNLAASQSGKRGKALANVAVRVTAPAPASYLTINLRGQQPLAYSATLLKDGKSQISEMKDGRSLPFENGQFARSPDFDPAGRHVMEFRAEGEVLTLIIDGRTVGTIQDASLSNGNFSVHGSVGSVIEKIEYRELPALPAAAQPSAPKETAALAPTVPVVPPPAAPEDPKLAALLANYIKAITNGLAAAAPADKSAFEAELARLKINAPLPDAAEDAKLPAELKRLRGILRAQMGP